MAFAESAVIERLRQALARGESPAFSRRLRNLSHDENIIRDELDGFLIKFTEPARGSYEYCVGPRTRPSRRGHPPGWFVSLVKMDSPSTSICIRKPEAQAPDGELSGTEYDLHVRWTEAIGGDQLA